MCQPAYGISPHKAEPMAMITLYFTFLKQVTSRREDEKPQTSNSFEEVIVIGGNGTEDTPLTSVKKAVVGKDHIVWVSLPPMNVPRSHVSSAVIGRQIFVIGGGTDSIETLKVDQLPLQWAMSKAVLPFCLFGHSSVVYQGRLIVIGGYNSSNGIFNFLLLFIIVFVCLDFVDFLRVSRS